MCHKFTLAVNCIGAVNTNTDFALLTVFQKFDHFLASPAFLFMPRSIIFSIVLRFVLLEISTSHRHPDFVELPPAKNKMVRIKTFLTRHLVATTVTTKLTKSLTLRAFGLAFLQQKRTAVGRVKMQTFLVLLGGNSKTIHDFCY